MPPLPASFREMMMMIFPRYLSSEHTDNYYLLLLIVKIHLTHMCVQHFQLQLNVNHAWVALSEIIEVQNALNQWLHFKIELNSRLFAFHNALCRRIAISNFFISQSPKTCSSFFLCECNSQDSFSHISLLCSLYNKLQLIY